MKKKSLFAVVFTSLFLTVESRAQTDYLMRNCQDIFLSPGGEGPDGTEGRMVKLDYWNLPRTVQPGQTVKSRIVWQTVSGNPNAVVFATVFGDWSPDEPLAQLYDGMLGRPGKVFERAFEFRAPSRTGRYRLRWIFPMAFKPISSFYSKQDRGSDDPGNAWWSEVDFFVESSDDERVSTDYLLQNCQDIYLSPGGEGAEGPEGRMLRLKYWNLPKTVRPSERVKSRIAWETLSGNPNAVVFATVVGNWDPDTPLAQLYRGSLGGRGKQFEGGFEFVAPDKPGRYRIRWIFPMAFKPIVSFYSKQDRGSDDPGNAWWSELDFYVQPR